MAKKKIKTEKVEEQVDTFDPEMVSSIIKPTVLEPEVEYEGDADVTIEELSEPSAPEVPAAPAKIELPEHVDTYFKRHLDVESVYMDRVGGTFPANIDRVFVKNATLYHNPYFNQ